MDTACYVASATITIASSTGDYTLDSSVLEIVDMYPTASGISYTMEQLTVPELNAVRRNATTAAAPTVYYALSGQNLLLFHPYPSTGGTFTMYYVPVPTALSAGTDDPSSATLGGIPTAYHKAIEYFACAEAADANDDESSQNGLKYFQMYQDQVKKIRRQLRRRGGNRMPRMKATGRRGFRGLRSPHDNSTYFSGMS